MVRKWLVRNCPSAKVGPQMPVRNCPSANVVPQMTVRKCRITVQWHIRIHTIHAIRRRFHYLNMKIGDYKYLVFESIIIGITSPAGPSSAPEVSCNALIIPLPSSFVQCMPTKRPEMTRNRNAIEHLTDDVTERGQKLLHVIIVLDFYFKTNMLIICCNTLSWNPKISSNRGIFKFKSLHYSKYPATKNPASSLLFMQAEIYAAGKWMRQNVWSPNSWWSQFAIWISNFREVGGQVL